MKKRFTRFLALIMAIIMCAGMFTMSVSAASATVSGKISSKKYTTDFDGGTSHTFYIKTNDKNKTHSVKLSMTKGELSNKGYTSGKHYNSYTLDIDYWNGSTWVDVSKYDVYNKSSHTISCLSEENTVYRVKVWSWKVPTLWQSYFNKEIIGDFYRAQQKTFGSASASWTTENKVAYPSFTVKSANRCTLYTGCNK